MHFLTFTFSTSWTEEDHAGPVSVDEVEVESRFGLFYPNPATEQANMKIDLEGGADYSVAIVDQSGRTVHTSRLQASGSIVYTINTSRLASGIYHVVFQNRDSRVSRKLVVR